MMKVLSQLCVDQLEASTPPPPPPAKIALKCPTHAQFIIEQFFVRSTNVLEFSKVTY